MTKNANKNLISFPENQENGAIKGMLSRNLIEYILYGFREIFLSVCKYFAYIK